MRVKFILTLGILVSTFTSNSIEALVQECPYEPDNAQATGQDCSIAKICVSTRENCHGKRICACDGFCGRRCLKVRREQYCSELNIPQDVTLEYDSPTRRAFNTTVTYTCKPGSLLLRGDLTRKCRGDGSWSGQEPRCVKIEELPQCPQLRTPPGVRMMGDNTSQYKSVRLFLCPHGFETEDGVILIKSQCQMDGSWSRQPPVCSDIHDKSDEITQTVNPCQAYSCEVWEKCVDVNGEPTCVCNHPSECDNIVRSVVCGTDGRNYTNLCQLKSMACFFGRDVELETERSCPPKDQIEKENYSLYSDDISNDDGIINYDYSIMGVDEIPLAPILPDASDQIFDNLLDGSGCNSNCVDDCPELDIPANVRNFAGSGLHIGAVRILLCHDGFDFEGIADGRSLTVECMDNGQWSSEIPHCVDRDPCDSIRCEHWQECAVVSNEARCYCIKPTACPAAESQDETVCGTDNREYETHCHMEATVCFFGRSITQKNNGPCLDEDDTQIADDYSLTSSVDEGTTHVPTHLSYPQL